MMDDTVSVLDVADARVRATIALGVRGEPTAAQRGEAAFFDARHSLDGWMSCHSCHTEGHANQLLNDNFDDETTGTPKRVLSLLGVADTGPWSWLGLQQTLESQVTTALQRTLGGFHTDDERRRVAADIAAYLRTLDPAPGVEQVRQPERSARFENGRALFERLDCGRCHRPPTYTSARTYDVGLPGGGHARLNPPSLRGVSQRDRFFHDGRARSLHEALGPMGHPDGVRLSAAELEALIRFLGTL
jgi:cytochrome c peroxidase